HPPLREQVTAFGFRFHLPREIEIGAVLHRVKDGASLRAGIGEQHRGGQMPRVGVDRVAEKRELDERDAEHHREREPVAPHLRELFHDGAAQPLEGKFRMAFHGAKLSFASFMRWMNTSSMLARTSCQRYRSLRN